jgi:hypothetical protein
MTTVMGKMQQAAEVSSVPASYAASGVSVLFGMTSSEWQAIGVLGGLMLGLMTLAVTIYFKRQHLKLAQKQQEK